MTTTFRDCNHADEAGSDLPLRRHCRCLPEHLWSEGYCIDRNAQPKEMLGVKQTSSEVSVLSSPPDQVGMLGDQISSFCLGSSSNLFDLGRARAKLDLELSAK
jgi:hypothetical protein